MSQYRTVWSHFFSRIQGHKRFILLIAFFLLLSAVFCSAFKSQKLWGDEETYLVESHTQPLSYGYFGPLVPGAMQYRWWPPFAFSFYALFSTDSLGNHYAGAASLPVKELEIERGRFLTRIAIINTILLLVAGTAIYGIGLLAGLGKNWSVFAAGLVLINPRILFFEQALWPEPLHLALFSTASLAFALFLGRKQQWYLVLSGLLFAYCALTKGISGIYVFLLAGMLSVLFFRTSGLPKILILLALFLLPYLLLTHAQKARNYLDHSVYALSSNTWINIEMGFSPYDFPAAEGYKNLYDRYFSTAATFKEREILAQQRVIEFALNESLVNIIANQTRNYIALLNRSFFKWGLERDRWANSSSLQFAEYLCILMSWFTHIMGVLGLLRYMFVNPVIASLGLFLIYYLSALTIVGFSPRLFVPAIPFLAIFTAFFLKRFFSPEKPDIPFTLPARGGPSSIAG